MAYSAIPSYKKDSRWYSRDGFFYVASRSRRLTTVMRCASDGCPARWTLKNEVAGPVVNNHDHAPTPWIPNRNAMFQALKHRASSETIPLIRIYEEEAARFEDAAPHLLWESVVPSMRKWRRQELPGIPGSLVEYAAALAEHQRHSHILLATVSAGGATAVILAQSGFAQCLRESSAIVVDGTFLTVPAGLPAAQLLTMHSIIEGGYFHPILVLMQNRTRLLYEAVFTRIWHAAGNPQPSYVITDFEPALKMALESVTGVQTHGCLFHFVQALLRRARQEGIQVARNTPGRHLVQLYTTLALLLAAQVPLGLAELPAIASQHELPFNEAFHSYFQTQWMTRVGPEAFSVHSRPHQTSNIAESYHASLRRSLGPSPNIWRFTDVIAEKFVVSVSRLQAQHAGLLPRRNRERHYIRATVLFANERALQRGTITLREFLFATSRLLNVGIGVIVDDIPEVDNEVEINVDVAPEPEVPQHTANAGGILCNICIENVPTLVLIPCGHILCETCFNNISASSTCPFCRSNIINSQRIYL